MLTQLSALRELELGHNRLTALPAPLPGRLQVLCLEGNSDLARLPHDGERVAMARLCAHCGGAQCGS